MTQLYDRCDRSWSSYHEPYRYEYAKYSCMHVRQGRVIEYAKHHISIWHAVSSLWHGNKAARLVYTSGSNGTFDLFEHI